MTINKLKKILDKLIADGRGLCQVHIDKTTFKHPLEGDGYAILPVETAAIGVTELLDDDGFVDLRCDGSVRCRPDLVLKGD